LAPSGDTFFFSHLNAIVVPTRVWLWLSPNLKDQMYWFRRLGFTPFFRGLWGDEIFLPTQMMFADPLLATSSGTTPPF